MWQLISTRHSIHAGVTEPGAVFFSPLAVLAAIHGDCELLLNPTKTIFYSVVDYGKIETVQLLWLLTKANDLILHDHVSPVPNPISYCDVTIVIFPFWPGERRGSKWVASRYNCVMPLTAIIIPKYPLPLSATIIITSFSAGLLAGEKLPLTSAFNLVILENHHKIKERIYQATPNV